MPGEQSDTYTETGSPLVLDTEKTTVQQSTITEYLTVEDDDDIRWGTDEDYITEYDSSADVWRLFDNGTNNQLFNAGTSELVFNEDGVDLDFRVESQSETGMLLVDAAENQTVIHGTSDPDYGALFAHGRTTGGGADQDIVATLGEDGEDIQLNGNNTGTVQNVQVQAGNWTSTNAVSPTNAVNFRVEGVPTFGTNVTPSNVYAMLVQNRAGTTDWFRITDAGRVDVPSGNLRIGGSNSIEDGSGNPHLTVNDTGNLDVDRTLNFPNITGTPTFANHDHSEAGLTTIPNSGLTNSSVTVSAGTGLSTDGDGTLNLGDTETYSISTAASDTSPGFTTSITTSGRKSVQLVVTHSPDSDTATDLQQSLDGGTSWTTVQTQPAAASNRTDSVSITIGPNDTLQFRDNSGTGASVTIDEYHERELA